MPQRDYLLRTEASYFPWNCLTQQQRAAIEHVAGFLRHSATILDTLKRDSTSELHRRRHSRLAFVDADRGMGKTTVLVTLERLIEKGDPSITQFQSEEDCQNAKWLHDNHGRFRWLLPLDMEPLPVHSNLLAAILVRIGQLMTPADSGSFLRQLDSRATLASDFSQLEQSAVHAWGGVSPARLATLDPAYATTEVITSQAVALDFNNRFESVLDQIAKGIDQEGAIFIVPIDDVDLTPTRCLELLRVVRMLSTPRLFFLIVGNIRNAEEMLRLQCEGELAALAGIMATSKTSDRIRSTSAQISSNHLRKLVPPHQRVRLRLTSPDEALDLRLPGYIERQEAGLGTLRGILERIQIHVNYLPQASGRAQSRFRDRVSLLEQIFAGRDDDYPGTSWLTGAPRQILDRAELLYPFANRSEKGLTGAETRSLLTAIAQDIRSGLLEDSAQLDSGALESIENVVQEYSGGVQFSFRERFTVKAQTRQLSHPTFSEVSIGPFHRVEWVIEYLDNIAWLPSNSQSLLDSRADGSLTLLHDLAQSLESRAVWTSSMVSGSSLLSPAFTRWTLSETTLDIPWVLPDWRTFREIFRFWGYLKSGGLIPISEIGRPDLPPFVEVGIEPDLPAMAWFNACLGVLLYAGGRGQRHLRDHKEFDPQFVAKELEALAKEGRYSDERSRLVDSGLVSLMLLLAPEAGGFGKFGFDILHTGLSEQIRHLRPAIQRRRQMRWDEAVRRTAGEGKSAMSEILAVERSFSNHSFSQFFGTLRDRE